MTALLAALLAATPAPPVTYTCGQNGCEVSDWSKAPRVFIATHDAPVYEKPDATSPISARLRFGVAVKILQLVSPELTRSGDRIDRWYRVASEGKGGYVFGDVLTSARFEDDFDGDQDLELATVAFTAEHQIRVRFYEPKTKTETFIDVRAAGEGYLASMKGGYAYPDAVGKAAAGLPLVHVDTHVEACADLGDYWVSYVGGTPRVALALIGLIDPPNHSTYQVQFQPAKKRALVKHAKVEVEDQPPVTTTETWSLDGGVFVRPEQVTAKPAE